LGLSVDVVVELTLL